jgi:hypothetical protein
MDNLRNEQLGSFLEAGTDWLVFEKGAARDACMCGVILKK